MATKEDFDALVAKFQSVASSLSSSLAQLGAEFTNLKEQITGGGLPAAVEADVLTRLGAAGDTLTSVASQISDLAAANAPAPAPATPPAGSGDGTTPPAPPQA